MVYRLSAGVVLTGTRLWLRWDIHNLRKNILMADPETLRTPIGDEDSALEEGHLSPRECMNKLE